MNEQDFGRKVAGHLSASARELDDGLLERLRVAREQALAVQRPTGRLSQIFGGNAGFRLGFPGLLRPVAVSVAILAAVGVGDYWSTWARVITLQEVDTALLSDDLPIDAYLDAEFKAWVQQDSRS
ncbi:MAG: DUF3619 family protein [Aromatoleum sp.]|jgi:hypothetical protein|uniref:DUF3619 family protein n=1 Tax=Aromatoleum sp. TaxID=2307007 RepID=UPI002894ECC8|nr:DUF3619 family protein [Aromatoleum sp.]MDT3669701.1 DUF3619 family protein [Aromatoleum sp.]